MRTQTRIVVDQSGCVWQVLCPVTEFLDFLDFEDEQVFDSMLKEEVYLNDDKERQNVSTNVA